MSSDDDLRTLPPHQALLVAELRVIAPVLDDETDKNAREYLDNRQRQVQNEIDGRPPEPATATKSATRPR